MTTAIQAYRIENKRRNDFQVGVNATHHLSPNCQRTQAELLGYAEREHVGLPQYAGHFDAYVLVRIGRDVVTKGGVAFKAGDLAIGKKCEGWGPFPTRWVVYSVRNGCDTQVTDGVHKLN